MLSSFVVTLNPKMSIHLLSNIESEALIDIFFEIIDDMPDVILGK